MSISPHAVVWFWIMLTCSINLFLCSATANASVSSVKLSAASGQLLTGRLCSLLVYADSFNADFAGLFLDSRIQKFISPTLVLKSLTHTAGPNNGDIILHFCIMFKPLITVWIMQFCTRFLKSGYMSYAGFLWCCHMIGTSLPVNAAGDICPLINKQSFIILLCVSFSMFCLSLSLLKHMLGMYCRAFRPCCY